MSTNFLRTLINSDLRCRSLFVSDDAVVNGTLTTSRHICGTVSLTGSGASRDPSTEITFQTAGSSSVAGTSYMTTGRAAGDMHVAGSVRGNSWQGVLNVSADPDVVASTGVVPTSVLSVVGGAATDVLTAGTSRADEAHVGTMLRVAGLPTGPPATPYIFSGQNPAVVTVLYQDWGGGTGGTGPIYTVTGVAVGNDLIVTTDTMTYTGGPDGDTPVVLSAGATGAVIVTAGSGGAFLLTQGVTGGSGPTGSNVQPLPVPVVCTCPTANLALLQLPEGAGYTFAAPLAITPAASDSPLPGYPVCIPLEDTTTGLRQYAQGIVSTSSGDFNGQVTTIHASVANATPAYNGSLGAPMLAYDNTLLSLITYGTPDSVNSTRSVQYANTLGGPKARYISYVVDEYLATGATGVGIPVLEFNGATGPMATLTRGIRPTDLYTGACFAAGGITCSTVSDGATPGTTVLSVQGVTGDGSTGSMALTTVFGLGIQGPNVPSLPDVLLNLHINYPDVVNLLVKTPTGVTGATLDFFCTPINPAVAGPTGYRWDSGIPASASLGTNQAGNGNYSGQTPTTVSPFKTNMNYLKNGGVGGSAYAVQKSRWQTNAGAKFSSGDPAAPASLQGDIAIATLTVNGATGANAFVTVYWGARSAVVGNWPGSLGSNASGQATYKSWVSADLSGGQTPVMAIQWPVPPAAGNGYQPYQTVLYPYWSNGATGAAEYDASAVTLEMTGPTTLTVQVEYPSFVTTVPQPPSIDIAVANALIINTISFQSSTAKAYLIASDHPTQGNLLNMVLSDGGSAAPGAAPLPKTLTLDPPYYTYPPS